VVRPERGEEDVQCTPVACPFPDFPWNLSPIESPPKAV